MSQDMLDGLVESGIKQAFIDHLEMIYDIWVQLQEETTLKPGTASTDERVMKMLKTLHCGITDPNHVKSRLASIQLTNLMAALKMRILRDRHCGIVQEVKRSDAIAIDLFVHARGGDPKHPSDRTPAIKQIRISKRWADLASGGPPLLIIALSEKADKLVSDFRYSNSLLKTIAIGILNHYPREIMNVANTLTELGKKGFEACTKNRATFLAELRNQLGGGLPVG